MMTRKSTSKRRTPLGRELEEAFIELAGFLRGEIDADHYEVETDTLTPDRIKAIRKSIANSTKEFERRFSVPARTMEAYEQGRRRPDAAMQALLRVIEREPEAVLRALERKAA